MRQLNSTRALFKAVFVVLTVAGMIGMHQLPSMASDSTALAIHHERIAISVTQSDSMADMGMASEMPMHCVNQDQLSGDACHSVTHSCQTTAADQFHLQPEFQVIAHSPKYFALHGVAIGGARATGDPPNLAALSIARI